LKHALALRCTGSAALDLAEVACGRRDGYWEHGVAPYDVAGGVLLVREAGGRATDYAGNPDAVHSGETVAANPTLHAEMIGYLKSSHVPVR
jgi:myo-inositol-1(or 4)-monophosphatase